MAVFGSHLVRFLSTVSRAGSFTRASLAASRVFARIPVPEERDSGCGGAIWRGGSRKHGGESSLPVAHKRCVPFSPRVCGEESAVWSRGSLGQFRAEPKCRRPPSRIGGRRIRPAAEDALHPVADSLKPVPLRAAHRQGNEADEKPSEVQRRRSVLKILAEMPLAKQDWQELRPLLQDQNLSIALTAAQIAVATSSEEEKQEAARLLIRSFDKAHWYLQMQIEDCLRLERSFGSRRDGGRSGDGAHAANRFPTQCCAYWSISNRRWRNQRTEENVMDRKKTPPETGEPPFHREVRSVLSEFEQHKHAVAQILREIKAAAYQAKQESVEQSVGDLIAQAGGRSFLSDGGRTV